MFERRLLLVLVGFVIFVAGCGDDDLANLPPTVTLEASPVEGDTVSYHVTLSWSGSDPDGRVSRYEIALDPPIEFSEEEIASGGPGILVWNVPGVDGAPDFTRWSKEVEGRLVYFDWVHTRDEARTFDFSAVEPESAQVDTVRRATGRFFGMHAVYVRAVDDDGDASRPERIAFTATTIAPISEITCPHGKSSLFSVDESFTMRWAGLDPDSPQPPAGYLSKALDLTELGLNCSQSPEVLYQFMNDNDLGWVYQDAAAPQRTFLLAINRCYLVAIRAVDQAGAVEPFLQMGRNVLQVRAVPNAGYPTLTIVEPTLGTFSFPYPGYSHEALVPANAELRFCWSAALPENDCGQIYGFRWRLSNYPEFSGPESDWSPWSSSTCTSVLRPTFGDHALYVQVQDGGGTINTAKLVLRYVSMPLDREILYVDDFADRTFPRAEQHDAFWFSLFEPVNSGGRLQEGEVSQYDVFGPMDTDLAPRVPDLEQLGRYRLLVWSCNGAGYNGASALLQAASKTHVLASYLRAGGKLWLTGPYTVAATSPPLGSGIADFEYPKMPEAGEFVWDFLKLQSDRIDNDEGEVPDHRFVRAVPADSIFTFHPHIYDAMHVDFSKFNPRSALKSVAFVDAIIDPIFAEQDENFRGDIDSLYVYGTAARAAGRSAPALDFRVCALRWHDPDPAREHGRVQWFGFPMYYFKTEQAQDTFNKSIDWFREESP